jgi:quinol monooxygenase YgiN
MRKIAFVMAWMMLAGPAAAETPPAYAVTYLEVKADAVAGARAALRGYGVASRKDVGNLRFEVLEEVGRPSRFAILEAWTSRAALDRHSRAALAPLVRVAPDDRRIYAGLYAAPPAHHAGPIHVMTHVDVMPPFAAGCAALLKTMRADTPADPGNVGYDVLLQDHELNHFTVAEVWASKRDFEAHAAAAHTMAFRQKLLPMTGALFDERVFTEIQ